jgi:hypothetical protein
MLVASILNPEKRTGTGLECGKEFAVGRDIEPECFAELEKIRTRNYRAYRVEASEWRPPFISIRQGSGTAHHESFE